MPRASPRKSSVRTDPLASSTPAASPSSKRATSTRKQRVTATRATSEDIDNDSELSEVEDEDAANEVRESADPAQEEVQEEDGATESLQGPADTRDLFYRRIYALVRLIPPGKVCTYGHLAKLAGRPKNSRLVGQALRFLPRSMAFPPQQAEAAGGDPSSAVPWHRVINSRGVISARGSIQAVRRQADWLRDEGVEVDEDGEVDPEELNPTNPHDQFAIGAMEGGRVSLRRFGWFPDAIL